MIIIILQKNKYKTTSLEVFFILLKCVVYKK